MKSGTWRVAERGDLYVVVEVYRHAAYGYIWCKKKGIQSHVWLFNCDARPSDDAAEDSDAPPAMDTKNISALVYRAPAAIDEISCVFNIATSAWDFHWDGQRMATLSEQKRPGESAFVRESNQLASTMDAAAG